MANKYGHYGSRFGISQETIRGAVNGLSAAIDEDSGSITSGQKPTGGFDRSKYKKV
jgi:hypothetical protein